MTRRWPTFAGLIVFAVAGCAPDAPDRDDKTAETPSPGTSVAGEPAPAASGTAPESGEPNRFRSEYTRLDLDACTVTRRETEGEGVTWRCPGFGGVPLVVNAGDGRFDIDAGGDDGEFDTIGAFNEPGETIEWRLAGDRPFAIIYRLRDVSMESGGRSALLVETVGTRVRPGCRVAQIGSDVAEANSLARRYADEVFAGDPCGKAEPRYVGNAR